MQEILVVAAIALAVIFIPRLMGRKTDAESKPQSRPQPRPYIPAGNLLSRIVLPGWMRAAIVLTFLWVAGCAAYFRPWDGNPLWFFCVSLGPAVAFWGGVWAWFGYKKYKQ